MSLKDTKILIPEIPGEWTQRSYGGLTNTWNSKFHSTGLPEVSLQAPQKGLYAERIDGAWYWVCNCPKCLGKDSFCSFNQCETHDRCVSCNCSRDQLTEAPWGVSGGWRCKPCQSKIHEAHKVHALENAAASGHSEDDCHYTDKILCPYCATEQSDDERHDSKKGLVCGVCDGKFDLEVEWTASYTTTKQDKESKD